MKKNAFVFLFQCSLLLMIPALAQTKLTPQQFNLDEAKGLSAKGISVEAVTFNGRKAVRLKQATQPQERGDSAVFLPGTDFQDGIIEIDLAAKAIPPAPNVRVPGFIGIAFRASADNSRYECFYIRPGNGRYEDQLVRNHAVQYVAEPDYGWYPLRRQWPGVYESYADLEEGAWTKVKIVVAGRTAKLYLHGASQPSLIIDDLRSDNLKGPIGLWYSPGTEAYFSNLRITPTEPKKVTLGTEATGVWDIRMTTDFGMFSGTLALKREGETITGTYSGPLGENLALNGTWKNGFVELRWRSIWPRDKSEAETVITGWLEGNTAKGRAMIDKKTDGSWSGTRRE